MEEYQLDKEDLKHILNVLRRGTITWKKRGDCLRKDRKREYLGQYKNGKEKSRWVYRCQKCKRFFDMASMEVDHIDEVGPFCGDFNRYVKRMYCSQDNLQSLCTDCHMKKTSGYNSSLKYTRKPLEE
jgi:5-methylcytosine-specific restriction endonuclease McrA